MEDEGVRVVFKKNPVPRLASGSTLCELVLGKPPLLKVALPSYYCLYSKLRFPVTTAFIQSCASQLLLPLLKVALHSESFTAGDLVIILFEPHARSGGYGDQVTRLIRPRFTVVHALPHGRT